MGIHLLPYVIAMEIPTIACRDNVLVFNELL